tara:strand:+ start:109 stop:474 length:366 start_codon:yes stop_codon:yes gene_type:complete
MKPDDLYRAIGQKIRSLRGATHQTQAQLAAQIGVSRASLANIEAGRQKLLLHHLYTIADALNLDTPTSLLPATHSPTNSDSVVVSVPLPDTGLSEKQRSEVLRLMTDAYDNNDNNPSREEP